MCFNLRGDFDEGRATDKSEAWNSTTGAHRRDLVFKLIARHDPDLLGVQEAYENQVRELDEAMPGHDVYGIGRDDGLLAGEQCAIYYRRDRFTAMSDGTFWLSNEPDQPSRFPGAACHRIASWVVLLDLENEDTELFVLNTHWDHVSAEAREHSAKLILQQVKGLAGDRPRIVMGDLNTDEQSKPLRVLLGEGEYIDSYRSVVPVRSDRERTFHGFQGGEEGSRIDFLLHGNRLRTTGAAIVRTSFDGRFPSDHYPVTATLEYASASSH